MMRFTVSTLILCLAQITPALASASKGASMRHASPSQSSLADQNQALSARFLKENQQKASIHTLASGLQYTILKEGEGASPGPTDFVTVHYRGTLINGKTFDSSYERKTPATFAVNAVIPGWTEALQLMKPGAHWTVYIPPALAYGKEGAGNLIGPNAALIFDIELLSVQPALEGEEGISVPPPGTEG